MGRCVAPLVAGDDLKVNECMNITSPQVIFAGVSNYDVVSRAGNLQIYTTPSFEALTLYIKEEYRGFGIGGRFMQFITEKYSDCICRLEVEEENERAVRLYEKCGFTVLPYMEMKK